MKNAFIVACIVLMLAMIGWTAYYFVERKREHALMDRYPGWQLEPPAPDSGPVAADTMLRGIYPAGSRIKDTKASGGFGPCSNFPHNLGGNDWGLNGRLSLVAFVDETVAYLKYKGVALRVINRTGETQALLACDSCLYIVQEALDRDGRWREIESPPIVICGNSFHRVFLESDQYWQFPARLYTGQFKTKVRFRLDPLGVEDGAPPVYSNEFDGAVAVAQFRVGPDRRALAQAMRDDPKVEGVISTLAEALMHEEASTRREAAMTLAHHGPDSKPAVPAILAAIKGPDRRLRATAAYALWRIDDQRTEWMPALIASLGDKESRWEAALWLYTIGPPAGPAMPALCTALADNDGNVRSKVVEAIGAIHAQPHVAIPTLVKALKDSHWLVRSYAGAALGRFGPEAKPAIPPLKDAARDNDGHVKVAAAMALWKIDANADFAVGVLIQVLRDEDAGSYAPASAAKALGGIGAPANAAVPELSAALKHENRGLRIAAAGALWQITHKVDPSLGVLIAVLQDRDNRGDSDTDRALSILEDMGSQAKDAVPALLATYSRGAQESVGRALKKIDAEAARKVGIR